MLNPVVYFIAGASRGIGLEFFKQILQASPSNYVIAGVRSPSGSTLLNEFISSSEEASSRAFVVTLDTGDQKSIDALPAQLSAIPIVQTNGIDVYLANAGILVGPPATLPSALDIDSLMEGFRINSAGPLLSAVAVLPFLREGKQKKIFATSSILGSTGGYFKNIPIAAGYGATKAAANFLFTRLAAELAPEGFTVRTFHPGYVDTDMNVQKPGEKPLAEKISTFESVSKTLAIMEASTAEENGSFFNYSGEEIVW